MGALASKIGRGGKGGEMVSAGKGRSLLVLILTPLVIVESPQT